MKIVYSNLLLGVVISLILSTTIIYVLLNKKYSLVKEYLFTSLIIINVFLLSVLYVSTQWGYLQGNHFSKQEAEYLVIEVTKPLVEKANTFKADIQIVGTILNDSTTQASGKAIVYFPKEIAHKINYGARIIIPNKLTEFEPSLNPNQFNYKQFQQERNIFHQGFFKEKELKLLNTKPQSLSFSFFNNIYKLQTFLSNTINNKLVNENNAAVANALLLGNKQLLSEELQNTYQQTGAMHILAVSGLHVGIVAFMILFILGAVPYLKTRWHLKYILAIIALWLFACLTGLAPSVTRASLMFSLLIIGLMLSRKTQIYNSLAASAIILLLINPFWLMELGFRLSYLAVLGIVVFHPKIMAWYTPKNWLLAKLWELNAVAVSAQILTLPLIISTFNQFPLVFFLSNPVALLGATITLNLGFLFFACTGVSYYFSSFDIITNVVAYCLSFVLSCLNTALQAIQQIPYGIVEKLFLNNYQFCLLCLIMGSIVFINNSKINTLRLALFTILVTSLLFINYKKTGQLEMCVFHINNYSAIGLRAGNTTELLHNLPFRDKLAFPTENTLIANGTKQTLFSNINQARLENAHLFKWDNFVQLGNKKILFVDKGRIERIKHWDSGVDYVLIKENPTIDLAALNGQLQPEKFIFDGSNNMLKCKTWQTECERLDLPCYFTHTDGAFTVILNQ